MEMTAAKGGDWGMRVLRIRAMAVVEVVLPEPGGPATATRRRGPGMVVGLSEV